MKIIKLYQRYENYLLEIPLDTSKETETILFPDEKVMFTVSSTDENTDFFKNSTNLPDTADFTVFINNEKSTQEYNNLSYTTGDNILIRLDSTTTNFPFWKPGEDGVENGSRSKYRIIKLQMPLPKMFIDGDVEATDFSNLLYMQDIREIPADTFSKNPNITTFKGCFSHCRNLAKIPQNLFAYNKLVESFGSCFKCTGITEIPEGLFNSCTEVTDFSGCFSGEVIDDVITGMGIVSIPADLFQYNTKVTDFSNCFQYNLVNDSTIASVDFTLVIGSPYVSKCEGFCSDNMNVTLYVPADSTTFDSFTALNMPNIRINTM